MNYEFGLYDDGRPAAEKYPSAARIFSVICVIASCPYAILSPEAAYETAGMTPNVVFTCGAWVEDDNEVKIYYGAADTVQCLATTTLDNLLDACFMK